MFADRPLPTGGYRHESMTLDLCYRSIGHFTDRLSTCCNPFLQTCQEPGRSYRDAAGRKEYREEMGSFSSVEFVLLRHRGGDYGSV